MPSTDAERSAAEEASDLRLTNAYYAAIEDPADEAALEALWSALADAGLCDESRKQCTFDGDLSVSRERLADEMAFRSALVGAAGANDKAKTGVELSVNIYRDRADIWPQDLRKLTYFIDEQSFSGVTRVQNAAAIVDKALEAATRAWEEACELCNIDFVKVDSQEAAVLVVRRRVMDYYAHAFFPNVAIDEGSEAAPPILDPQRFNANRSALGAGAYLYIDDKFFPAPSSGVPEGFSQPIRGLTQFANTDVSQVWLMQHELGHILGYRHEFVSARLLRNEGFSKCPAEAENLSCQSGSASCRASTISLVDEASKKADPNSVMMYPCARRHFDRAHGAASGAIKFDYPLSDCDKKLHRALYTGTTPPPCDKRPA